MTYDDVQYLANLRIKNKSVSSTSATVVSVPCTYHLGEKFPLRFYDKPKEPVLMHTAVRIEDFVRIGLHDTGAINADLLTLLTPKSVHRITACAPFRIRVSVKNDEQYFIKSSAEVIISMQGHKFLWEFFICPNLSHDIVFGTDFMYAYNVSIDVRKRRLNFGVADFWCDTNWQQNIPESLYTTMDIPPYKRNIKSPTPPTTPITLQSPQPQIIVGMQAEKTSKSPNSSEKMIVPPPNVNSNEEKSKSPIKSPKVPNTVGNHSNVARKQNKLQKSPEISKIPPNTSIFSLNVDSDDEQAQVTVKSPIQSSNVPKQSSMSHNSQKSSKSSPNNNHSQTTPPIFENKSTQTDTQPLITIDVATNTKKSKFREISCEAIEPESPPLVPFQKMFLEYYGPFTTTLHNNNMYVFVAIDITTNYAEIWPTKSSSSDSAIPFLEDHICDRHSPPLEIICSKKSNFIDQIFSNYCRETGISLEFKVAENSNASIENKKSQIKKLILESVKETQMTWDLFIPAVAYAENIAVDPSTQISPFKLVYGYDPILPSQVQNPILIVNDQRFNPIALKTSPNEKPSFHKKRKQISYTNGDFVLHLSHDKRVGSFAKVKPKWLGPFLIVSRVSEDVYKILDMRDKSEDNRERLVVNGRDLKPYEKYIHSGDISDDATDESDNEQKSTQSSSDFNFSVDFKIQPNNRSKLTEMPIFRANSRSNSSIGVPPPSRESSRPSSHRSSQFSVSQNDNNSRCSEKSKTNSSKSYKTCNSGRNSMQSSHSDSHSLPPSVSVVSLAPSVNFQSQTDPDSSDSESDQEQTNYRRSMRTKTKTSRYSPGDFRR